MYSSVARLGLGFIAIAGIFAIVLGYSSGTVVTVEGVVTDKYVAAGLLGMNNNYVKVSTDTNTLTVTVDGILYGDLERGTDVTVSKERCFYGLYETTKVTVNAHGE